MGKDPAQFVPVKYGPGIEGNQVPLTNMMLGGLFIFALFKLYQQMHGKSKPGGKAGGSGLGGGKGGGFGDGGIGSLMNMSKSGA